MNLKKCPNCKNYTLNEVCLICKKDSKDAHYKFIKIKDAPKSNLRNPVSN